MDKPIIIPKGNDFPLTASLSRKDGSVVSVYDLDEATNIRLALVGHGMHVFARDVETSGNTVTGILPGNSLLVGP